MNMISSRIIISDIIFRLINNKEFECLPEFIDVFNKNQYLLSNILENDPLNANDRNSLLKSPKEGINIAGISQKIHLSPEYIQEAIIISDMFKLNEMTAVELLLFGEAEKSSSINNTRGLMAVLKYYDSQKCIVESLKLLLQAKLILHDDSSLSIEAVNFIESYLDKLFNDGLFNHILNKIKLMNIDDEVNMLESQKALGTSKHRRQFYSLFNTIKKTLCECILLRSYKTPLNKCNTIQLIEIIRDLYDNSNIIKKEEFLSENSKAIKYVDGTMIYLLMSIISSINPIINGNSVMNYSKECFNHPFFSDDDYQKDIDKILKNNMQKIEYNDYIDNEDISIIHNIDRILYFSWAISMQKVLQLRRENNINNPHQFSTGFGDVDDSNGVDVIDILPENIFNCFQFLKKVIEIPSFHEENIWVKNIHDMVTDFIIYMPKMLKDLRNESKKVNAAYYNSLLELIGMLYGGENKFCEKLELQSNILLESLALEYWSPQEIVNYSDHTTLLIFEDNFKCWNIKSNDSFKQAVLFKFIRDSCDLTEDKQFLMSYIFMLNGLCCSNQIAVYIYSLLNNNQICGQQHSIVTWEFFSNSLQKYAHFFMSTPNTLHIMAPVELNSMLLVLKLIKSVSHYSNVVCTSMLDNESLMILSNITMLLSCGVPELLKAELINCLSVFCVNSLAAKSIWNNLGSYNIISHSSYPMKCNILVELDEIEPQSQEFFITRAFLNLLLSEVTHIVSDLSLFDPMMTSFDHTNNAVISSNIQYTALYNFTNILHMVMDTVFLKHTMRNYKHIEEKFVICESFLKLCFKCVNMFMIQVGNLKVIKGKLSWCQYDPGFFIINQLLNDSPFFKTIILIIDSGFMQINDCLNNVSFGSRTITNDAIVSLQNSIYYAMSLIHLVLSNENFLTQLIRELTSKFKNEETNRSYARIFRNSIPQELSSLLMSSSCTQTFLPNLMKHISLVDECEKISRKALSIFILYVDLIEPQSNIILMLTNKNIIDIDVLPLFVNCIDKFDDVDPIFPEIMESRGISSFFLNEFSPDSPRTLVLKLLITCLKKSSPNLGHFLLGFSYESIDSLKRTSLQEAGVGDCPKTCLHAILNLIQRLSSDIVKNNCFDNNKTTCTELTQLTIKMMDLSLALKIIHILASDPNTSVTVLRFIRSNYQLIFNQLDLLSFKTNKVVNIPELQALFWNQKSWLLKIIAIEIRQCTASQQKSYVVKLLKLLFGEDTFETNNESVFNKIYGEEYQESCESEGLIYELFDDMDISESENIIDFSRGSKRFRSDILKEYLSQCVEENDYNGLKLIKGDKLKQLILADVIVNVEDEQMQSLHSDICDICNTIDIYNSNEIIMTFGKKNVLEGWRHVVEIVMISECSGDESIEVNVKTRKVCDILIRVMKKVLITTTPSSLMAPLSTISLIMTAVLGTIFLSRKDCSLISNRYLVDEDVLEMYKANSLNMGQLDYKLATIINLTTDCILKLNTKHLNTRIKFYSAMTYLLQIALKSEYINLTDECYAIINQSSPSLLLSSFSHEQSLYPSLCRDAVSGNIHLSLSSLTLLDIIANIDKDRRDLITYLVTNGYLQHLINSLVKDCGNLFTNMKQEPTNDCSTVPYYLYQSNMSLLCKLATQLKGANVLIQYGVMSRLSQCEVFRVRPSYEGKSSRIFYDVDSESDCHDMVTLYSNTLGLAVQLCSTILSTKGIDQMESVREVHMFVGEFIDALCAPFQSSTSAQSVQATNEMINISSLFLLLSSAILCADCAQQEGYYYRTLEKIKMASSQMLGCLLGVLHDPVNGIEGTMQYLLQIQLMKKLTNVVTSIVSTGSKNSHKLLFFSNNIDGILSCRNNWNVSVKQICHRMFSGDKPSLSMVIMLIYKIQDCLADIERKTSRIVEMVAVQTKPKNMSLDEVEQNLEKMSTDQLNSLWSSIFENSVNTIDYLSVEYMDSDLTRGLLSTKSELIKDLLMIYKKMCQILTGLANSLECCTFLMWHHVGAYKSASIVKSLNQFNDNLHPLQRLQIMEQETKKELIVNARGNNISKVTDFVSTMSKCLDEEFLKKLQRSLEEHCEEDEASFSKVMIHQLNRMLKFI